MFSLRKSKSIASRDFVSLTEKKNITTNMNLKTQNEEKSTNASSVIMHPLMQTIWGDIWKPTVGKSQTIAASAVLDSIAVSLFSNPNYSETSKLA